MPHPHRAKRREKGAPPWEKRPREGGLPHKNKMVEGKTRKRALPSHFPNPLTSRFHYAFSFSRKCGSRRARKGTKSERVGNMVGDLAEGNGVEKREKAPSSFLRGSQLYLIEV